jgi:hypothetical protein
MAVFRLSSSKVQSEIKHLAEIASGQGWELSAAAPFSAACQYALYHVYSTAGSSPSSNPSFSSSSSRRRHGRKQKQKQKGRRQFVAVWKSLENGEFLASCSCSPKSSTSVLCPHVALASYDFFVFYAAVSLKTGKVARSSNRHDRECDNPPRPIFVFS